MELDGLTARRIAGEPNVILPVWHDVGADDIRSYSLPLADLVAAKSSEGVDAIADRIVSVLNEIAAGEEPQRALGGELSTDERPSPTAKSTHTTLTAAHMSTIQTKRVSALSFSPDSQNLAVATATNSVQIFDTAKWSQRLLLRQSRLSEASIFTVAFSPLGYELATGGSVVDGGLVQLWYTDNGRRGIKIPHAASVWALAFSPDGQWLVTGDMDGNVHIWKDVGSAKLLMRMAHNDQIYGVAFSPDGHRFATGSSDRTARIWDSRTGKPIAILAHDHGARAVEFSADSRLLATVDTHPLIWDAFTGTKLSTLSPKPASVGGHICLDVAFSPDARFVAAAYSDNTVRLYNTHTGAELAKLPHGHVVHAVTFSPNGRWLASGDGPWKTTLGPWWTGLRSGPGALHIWRLAET